MCVCVCVWVWLSGFGNRKVRATALNLKLDSPNEDDGICNDDGEGGGDDAAEHSSTAVWFLLLRMVGMLMMRLLVSASLVVLGISYKHQHERAGPENSDSIRLHPHWDSNVLKVTE